MDVNDLRARRATLRDDARALNDLSIREQRDLTREEQRSWDNAQRDIANLSSSISRLDYIRQLDEEGDGSVPVSGSRGDAPRHATADSGDHHPVLRRDQSISDWCRREGLFPRGTDDSKLSFDRYLRGIITGNWDGAVQERALAEGTATAGGHLVPTPLSARVIDLARNQTRVFQAGAVTVPMTAQTLKVARLANEGTPGWHAENAAITPADVAFDSVTFTARTLARLIQISVELFEDSDPSVGEVIAQSFAAQIALELDRVALRGSGTVPEPRGILNQAGVIVTNHGAAGTAITNYDWWLDAVAAVAGNNFTPNYHIQAPRTSASLAKLKEATTNAYLIPPSSMLPMLSTKQIPTNLTVTTSSDCSEVYTGQWDQLMIGMRTELVIELLKERYMDNMQFGMLAYLRADVQLSQPTAFNVDLGVRP